MTPRRSRTIGTVLHLLLAGCFGLGGAARSGPCEDLASAHDVDLQILAATSIRPGRAEIHADVPDALPDVPFAVCRLNGMIDGTIGFELWLPGEWNGKLFSAGVGAYAGNINTRDMAPALERGYATSSTDTGHQGPGARFMQDPEALENYAYRGVHRTAEIAKRLIESFYGKRPDYSYFSGCSGGGYAGLANALRYPSDYDGIVSGAPGTLVTHHAARAMWTAALNRAGQPGHIPPAKDRLIPDAFTAACDAGDGVRDGLVENPLDCDFDLGSLTCPADTDEPNCLTPAQVTTARQLYGPMHDTAGALVYPATAPGTPLPADSLEGRGEFYAEFWKHAVFGETWNPASFDVDDVHVADRKLLRYLDAGDADLSGFRERGGKLILYHGWHDSGVSPLNTIDYYERLDDADGEIEVREYARLFLAPGMAHCRGGVGPDQFDTLGALERWVENGRPPELLVASQYDDGRLIRTRPLCPYPEVAVYDGTGSSDAADNFECRQP